MLFLQASKWYSNAKSAKETDTQEWAAQEIAYYCNTGIGIYGQKFLPY